MIRMSGVGLETTGSDPQPARIVQYGFAHVGGNQPTQTTEQIVNPGVDVPEEATQIHGLTTKKVQEHGTDPTAATTHIVNQITQITTANQPLVGHNISYDLTVLDRECRRHLGAPLETLIGAPVRPVVDTLVLSKHLDPYRRRVSKTQGAHQLRTCVEQLVTPKWPTIVWDEDSAHGALYDCRMSLYVAAATLNHPSLHRLTPDELHEHQTQWRAQQCASFQEDLRHTYPGAQVDRRWPPLPPSGQQQPIPLWLPPIRRAPASHPRPLGSAPPRHGGLLTCASQAGDLTRDDD